MPARSRTGVDSRAVRWAARPGLLAAKRHLERHPVPVEETPLDALPRLSRRAIGLALRVSPGFLDGVNLEMPVILAGNRWFQMVLDGRHRLSKATWEGLPLIRSVRLPLHYAAELLVPGVYEAEWLYLLLRRPSPAVPPGTDRSDRRENPLRPSDALLNRRPSRAGSSPPPAMNLGLGSPESPPEPGAQGRPAEAGGRSAEEGRGGVSPQAKSWEGAATPG